MSRGFVGYGYNILNEIENNLPSYVNVFRKHKSKDILICHMEECHGTPFNFNTQNKSTYNELEKLLKNNDLKLIYVYGGFEPPINFNIENLEIYNWPTFLLHLSHNDMTMKYNKSIKDLNINTDFDNFFICLNNVPKSHRAMMLDYLCKYELLNKGKFSWNQLANSYYQKYEFKYWKEEITIIDNAHGTYTNHYGNVYTNDLLNYKSLINLVGETFDHVPFISEKTYKCLLLGQPFVSYGCVNQNLLLKKLGFQLYDEIFDNYLFDELPKIEDRIEGIVKYLQKIVNEDYNVIYQKIKSKVEFNKKRAIEIINKDPFIPEKVIDLYKTHKEQFLLTDRVPYYFEKIIKNRL
jgi:hypothetical protein